MKLGLSAKMRHDLYGRWGEKHYEKLRSLGYDCVDLDLSDTESSFYTDPAVLLEEKRLADAAGITFCQIHGPWRWPAKDFTEEDRAERFEKMKQSLSMTAQLDCKYWVIHPLLPCGNPFPDTEENRRLTVEITRDFMKKLLPEAKKHGVTICFENMPFGANYPLSTPKQILDFVETINDDHFQVCYDTGHAAIFLGKDAGEGLRLLGKHVKTLHVHDNDGTRDAHAFPFTGIIDWADFTKALTDIGYEGVFSLETLPNKDLPNEEYEQELKKLAQLAKKLIP